MNWLKWILAYLFDCVHLHRPPRNRIGCVYVARLDCGRELPYSLERMRVATRALDLRFLRLAHALLLPLGHGKHPC
jgi:hypothetical protein